MPKTRKPAFSWDSVPMQDQVLLINALADDGHSVYDADSLNRDLGLRPEILAQFTHKQVSDGTWKGTTWSNETGQAIEPVAVYGLDVLRSLAHHYGVTSTAFGRGTEARQLTAGLREKFKS